MAGWQRRYFGIHPTASWEGEQASWGVGNRPAKTSSKKVSS